MINLISTLAALLEKIVAILFLNKVCQTLQQKQIANDLSNLSN